MCDILASLMAFDFHSRVISVNLHWKTDLSYYIVLNTMLYRCIMNCQLIAGGKFAEIYCKTELEYRIGIHWSSLQIRMKSILFSPYFLDKIKPVEWWGMSYGIKSQCLCKSNNYILLETVKFLVFNKERLCANCQLWVVPGMSEVPQHALKPSGRVSDTWSQKPANNHSHNSAAQMTALY